MPEMKICPNCGKEILAVAKKCKYCGTWIEPKHEFRCPVCCEVIPEDSVICPVCHERLRPDPEPAPAPEPEIVVEEAISAPVAPDHPKTPEAKPRLFPWKWICGSVAAVLVIGLVAFLVLKPQGNSNAPYDDAKVLHEWFFNGLGTHVSSISDVPALKQRLIKMLGKKSVEGIEDLLANSSFNEEPNISITHDTDGGDVYQLVGVRQSASNSESFLVKYIDYGDRGFLDASAMIAGSHKSGKETVKKPHVVSPIVRQWEYEGRKGVGRKAPKIEMTLLVDGPGVEDNKIKGYYEVSGSDAITLLEGTIVDQTLTLEEIDPEAQDEPWFIPYFEFELDKSLDQSPILNGDWVNNYGHDPDPETAEGEQGLVMIPVNLSRSGSNASTNHIGDNQLAVKYEGKIYDSDHSYEIFMTLNIENNGGWGDKVTGHYRYKSQPESNVIGLSGEIYSEKGTVLFLDLDSDGGSERFSFTFTDDLALLGTIEGEWLKIKDGITEKEMNVLLTKQ